jgi:prophage antirepressor-like protein
MYNDVYYFKAREVATMLGYINTTGAIIDHVDNEYKKN